MQLTLSTAAVPQRASDRRARRLDAQRGPGALRDPAARRRRRPRRAARHRHGGRPAAARWTRPSRRPGEVVLPARLLLDVVRSLPGPDGRARAARPPSSDVEIVSAGATFHLRTLRNDDFPHLPTAGRRGRRSRSTPRAFVDTVHARLALGLARRHAAGAHRASSCGPSEHELRMVATDSYRLSVKTTPLEDAVDRAARGERAGARAGGGRAHRAAERGRHDRDRAQREPDHLHASTARCSPRA